MVEGPAPGRAAPGPRSGSGRGQGRARLPRAPRSV